MLTLPMALPFVVLLVAVLVAMLGFRRISIWVWLAGAAVMVAVFLTHVTDPLKIAL